MEAVISIKDKYLVFPVYIRVVLEHRWSMLLSMLRVGVRAVCYNWGARPGANAVASITTLQYNLVPSYTRRQRLTQFAPGGGWGCAGPLSLSFLTRPSSTTLVWPLDQIWQQCVFNQVTMDVFA